MGYAEINVYLPSYLDFTSSRHNHNIIPESTVGHLVYKPGLWTGLDWMVDWTLDSIMDSIIGLEFGTPGLKGHRQST